MERIPPLELAFRVAQLGGWENVELLTYYSMAHVTRSSHAWMAIGSLKHVQFYMDPDARKHWHVFDVRRKE